MIELGALLYVMAGIFGFIGYQRGLSKELISLAGIILALFALFQFNNLLLNVLLAAVPPEQKFIVQSLIFGVIVFFAYQTRGLSRRLAGDGNGRDSLQSTLLGALVGAINGYMIWGSLWYFMHINGYPLSPFISAPVAGTQSADMIGALPLYLLAGGPAGDGNLLSFAVILLFVFVLILI